MDIKAGEVADSARETMRDVQGRMSEGVENLRGYADTIDAAIREFAREKPMAAIAVAAGVGFLLGRLAARA